MATIVTSEIFTVGDATTVVESVSIPVVAAPVVGDDNAKGRIIHPTYGTYDYTTRPDEWGGFDSDAIVPPILASERTLVGTTNTIWPGYLKDVEVYERWTSDAAMTASMLRMLISFWQNPPSLPEYIQWSPNYISDKTFKVLIEDISTGAGKGVNFNFIMLQAVPYVRGKVTLKMRLIDYA